MSEYEKNAQSWAEKYGVRFEATFTGHRKYFDGDADTRDVYQVLLIRDGRSMTFEFGESLVDSRWCEQSRGPFWTGVVNKRNSGRHNDADILRHFSTRKPPTLYSVMASMEKNELGTFEEWCGDMGLDTDSRKAMDTYLACQKQEADFRKLCGGDAEMIEEAQEIQ